MNLEERLPPKSGPDEQSRIATARASRLEGESRLGLGLLQLFWFVITFLVLSLFIVGLAGYYRHLVGAVDGSALQSLGITPQEYGRYLITLDVVVILAHIVIASVIFFRRPFDWMALLVATALVVNGSMIPISHSSAPSGLNQTTWNLLLSVVAYTGLVTSIVLLTLFPDGHFTPKWTRPFALAWANRRTGPCLAAFATCFAPAWLCSAPPPCS